MAHPEDREEGCTLRIFHLNDVYLLDNFPRIKTLIQTKRTKNTITTLAGDFVSPSLLSRLGQNLSLQNKARERLGPRKPNLCHGNLVKPIALTHNTFNMGSKFQVNVKDSYVISFFTCPDIS